MGPMNTQFRAVCVLSKGHYDCDYDNMAGVGHKTLQ